VNTLISLCFALFFLAILLTIIPWAVIIGGIYYVTAWVCVLFTPEHNTPPGTDKYPTL
jgi:hypothetical protein